MKMVEPLNIDKRLIYISLIPSRRFNIKLPKNICPQKINIPKPIQNLYPNLYWKTPNRFVIEFKVKKRNVKTSSIYNILSLEVLKMPNSVMGLGLKDATRCLSTI